MRMQRWMLGTMLVTMAAGCAAPMPVTPAQPAATVPVSRSAVTTPAATPVTKTPVAPPTVAKAPVKPTAAAAPVVLQNTDLAPVMAKANAALPANLQADTQVDLTTLAVLDEELTAKQLLARPATGFATAGWFSDLKDKFTTWIDNLKLKREAKQQLKDNDDFVAAQQADKISWLKKNSSEPVVTTKELPEGGKEVTTVWTDANGPKAGTVTVVQVFDADGVEHSAMLTDVGEKANQSWETLRSRKLLDENGTREVYTKRTATDKSGRPEIHEWTRLIQADRTETITGTITNRNGKVITFTGKRSADGKLTIDPVTTVETGTTTSATPDW